MSWVIGYILFMKKKMNEKPLDGYEKTILEMNQFIAFLEEEIKDEEKRNRIIKAVEELIKQRIKGLLKEMEEIELNNMTLINLWYKIKQLIKKYFPEEVKMSNF